MCSQHGRQKEQGKKKRTANDQITAPWNNTAWRTGSAKLSGSHASHVGVSQRNEGLSEKRLQLGKFRKHCAWLLSECARGQRDICTNYVHLRIIRSRGRDLGLIFCHAINGGCGGTTHSGPISTRDAQEEAQIFRIFS